MRGKRLKFGMNFLIRNKAFTFLFRKTKPNRKKVVLPTDIYNIG